MKITVLVLVGLIIGAPIGAALGVAAGLASVKIFKISDFEGYSGTLVFLTFMPIGAIAGGILAAILLVKAALQR